MYTNAYNSRAVLEAHGLMLVPATFAGKGFFCVINGKVLKTDDLTGGREDDESSEESLSRPKKRHAQEFVPEPTDKTAGDASERRARKNKPKSKSNRKERHEGKQEHESEKKVEESAAVKAGVEGAPGEQTTEGQVRISYGKHEERAEPEPEHDQASIESAPAPVLSNVQEKHEEVAATAQDPDPQPETGSAGTETGYKALPDEQYAQKRIIGRLTLKRVLIALAVVIMALVLLFYAMSNVHLKSGSSVSTTSVLHSTTATSSSVLTTTASTTVTRTATVQVAVEPGDGVAAHTGSGSYSGNSVISVSGTVSPPPGSLNSAVLISVVGPGGVQVEAAEAPVSASGAFTLSFMAGGTSGWSDGTYTVTSDYYGTSGRTTFFWTAAASNDATVVIESTLCSVYTMVHNAIFLLSILLVVLGAAVYAFGHVMPGQHKGQFQGYGMNIVIGGIVGTLMAVLAPFVLKTIASGTLPVASCISGLV